MIKMLFLFFVSISSSFALSQPLMTDLTNDLDDTKQIKLQEYNSTFIQEQTYFSKRYKLIMVNIDALKGEDEIIFRPFPNTDPIHLLKEDFLEIGDSFAWNGYIKSDSLPNSDLYKLRVSIGTAAWDVDKNNIASESFKNTSDHSEFWTFDDSGNLIIDQNIRDFGPKLLGPPPESKEDIEKHRRFKSLRKKAFYSVNSTITTLDGTTYSIIPLRYTPKYSLLMELDRDKVFKLPSDPYSSSQAEVDSNLKSKVERYQHFVDSLPRDDSKTIKEDL